MRKFISTVLIIAFSSSTVPALADGEATVTPLAKGQPAPYEGVLLSPDAVANIMAEKDEADEREKLAVQHQADVDAANTKYQIDVLNAKCLADATVLRAELDDNKKQVNLLTDQLKKNSGSTSTTTWIGVGAVGGVVVTLLTVFIVSKASK